MTFIQRTHIGHPSARDIELVEELLDNVSNQLAPLQARLRDHKGRVAETSLKAFVGYGILNEMAGNRATLINMLAIARGLDPKVRERWGDTSPDQSYKRLTTLMRRASEILGRDELSLDDFVTNVLEAQLDASGIDYGTAAAFDGTVIRSAAVSHYRKPTEAERKAKRALGRNPETQVVWSKDTDAAHGHYPSKEGQREYANGYEAHIASPIPTVKGMTMPVVASALSFQPNSTANRPAIRDLLIQRNRYTMVVFDAGYDFKGNNCFQKFLEHGIAPIFDPNKKLRKGRSSSHGKLILDGDEFCPSTPERLRNLPSFAQTMSEPDRIALEALYDERAKYMMARVSHDGKRVRSMCPAIAGKVACPEKPRSMNNDDPNAPEVIPPKTLPKCCGQKTTSTNVELLRRSRQGQHPYGTTDWGQVYRQRNRIESYNALVRHNIGNLAERSWARVFGRCQVGLLFGFKLLATNIRSIQNFLHDQQ